MNHEKITTHDVVLEGTRVRLRPLTEDDWDVLLRWNSDPEVLYYSEGADVQSYSLRELQSIYRGVSRSALCFVIEVEDRPVGECWLQRMNLDRILDRYPTRDCRRIDLMIGEKHLWGRGYGTEVISILTSYAFAVEGADLVFGCDIADYNQASRRAFEKCGYVVDAETRAPADDKATVRYDLATRRASPCRQASRFRSVSGTVTHVRHAPSPGSAPDSNSYTTSP